jgi:hypothetical protein
MPINLIKEYNQLLDLIYPSHAQNIQSLRGVFNKDIASNIPLSFRGKEIHPTTSHDGEDAMDRLFKHLTTVITDEKTRKREFESERSIRLHWVKYHLDESKAERFLVFSIEHERRTYLLDKDEKYVIILEPKRNLDSLYLLTAYKLEASNYRNILTKYDKRGIEGCL